MTAAPKLAGFAVLVAAAFAAALAAGGALDPGVSSAGTDAHEEENEMSTTHIDADADHGELAASAPPAGVPGLAVAAAGHRLELERTTFAAGPRQQLSFRIAGEDGETLDDFDRVHERRLHLIVVRRDFEAFQHLHPTQLGDGSWQARADLSRAGSYRVFADFSRGGESLTLGSEIAVGGSYDPVPLAPPRRTADAGDGYEVAISRTEVPGGSSAAVRFTVTRNGEPIGALDPYLGADGHLVALREGDQAFLHTHPRGEPGGVGPIVFDVEYPSPGRYRLFLQFEHRGEVRTAAFTQEATDGGH